MNLNIKTSVYKEAGVADFPGIYREIINAILNAPLVFTSPPFPAATLTDSVTAMLDTTEEANRGGEVEKTARRDQHAVCINILDQLAPYVLQVASSKPTPEQKIEVVQISKFTLVKQNHEPAPPLPQVSSVSAKWTGEQGQAVVEWARIQNGGRSYNIYISLTAPGPDTEWQFAGSTTRKKFILNNLPNIGTQVWVHVRAVGKDNEMSVPSAPVLVLVEPTN